MLKKWLKGTGVAIITPFDNGGKIDFNALGNMVAHVVDGGVDYITILGTTGESVTLDKEEKKDILQYIETHPKTQSIRLIVGIGGNNTKEIEHQFSALPLKRIDAIMSVSPYYNKPSQEGIFQHYKYLAANAPKPIILYNVPGRTSRNIEVSTVVRLAEQCPNTQGIKEANDHVESAIRLLRQCPADFFISSGEDSVFLPLLLLGFDGLVSVAANVFPKQISSAVHHALNGNASLAKDSLFPIYDAIGLMFAENNPAGVKAFLSEMKVIQPYLRLPLVEVSDSLREKIKQAIR